MIRTEIRKPTLRVLSGGPPPPPAANLSSKGRYIIMSGNLSEGFVAWGTFDSFEMATQYVFQYLIDEETWVMPLKEKKSRPS